MAGRGYPAEALTPLARSDKKEAMTREELQQLSVAELVELVLHWQATVEQLQARIAQLEARVGRPRLAGLPRRDDRWGQNDRR
jgi:hypothetical protein